MTELSHNNDYYRRRAQHLRDLAGHAANKAIARIHLEMAERYEELATATASEVNERRNDFEASSDR